MRFLFVVVAGAIGWLWFAARAPADEPAPPSLQVRRADLTDLGAQVAMARSAELPGASAAVQGAQIEHADELADPDAHLEDTHVDTDADHEDTVDESLEDADPELADLAEQAQLAIFDRPPPSDAIDLSHHDDYGEVIVIEGHAPIIDATSTSCGGVTIDREYTVHIPVGRTFEAALAHTPGAEPNGDEYTPTPRTFGLGDEVVTFSSGGLVENEYIVDEGDQPAIDQPEPPPVWEIE